MQDPKLHSPNELGAFIRDYLDKKEKERAADRIARLADSRPKIPLTRPESAVSAERPTVSPEESRVPDPRMLRGEDPRPGEGLGQYLSRISQNRPVPIEQLELPEERVFRDQIAEEAKSLVSRPDLGGPYPHVPMISRLARGAGRLAKEGFVESDPLPPPEIMEERGQTRLGELLEAVKSLRDPRELLSLPWDPRGRDIGMLEALARDPKLALLGGFAQFAGSTLGEALSDPLSLAGFASGPAGGLSEMASVPLRPLYDEDAPGIAQRLGRHMERPLGQQLALEIAGDPLTYAGWGPSRKGVQAARRAMEQSKIRAGQKAAREQMAKAPIDFSETGELRVGAAGRRPLALPPISGRVGTGPPGRPLRPKAPIEPMPQFDPYTLVIVDDANPHGQRLIFKTQRELDIARAELGHYDMHVLPGNATMEDVSRAASEIPEADPGFRSVIPAKRWSLLSGRTEIPLLSAEDYPLRPRGIPIEPTAKRPSAPKPRLSDPPVDIVAERYGGRIRWKPEQIEDIPTVSQARRGIDPEQSLRMQEEWRKTQTPESPFRFLLSKQISEEGKFIHDIGEEINVSGMARKTISEPEDIHVLIKYKERELKKLEQRAKRVSGGRRLDHTTPTFRTIQALRMEILMLRRDFRSAVYPNPAPLVEGVIRQDPFSMLVGDQGGFRRVMKPPAGPMPPSRMLPAPKLPTLYPGTPRVSAKSMSWPHQTGGLRLSDPWPRQFQGRPSHVGRGEERARFRRPSDIPFEARSAEEAEILRRSVREGSSPDRVALEMDRLRRLGPQPGRHSILTEIRKGSSAEEVENMASVIRGEVPPDNPDRLRTGVSFPEGKPRLSDPSDFATEVGVAAITGRIPRIVQAAARPIPEFKSARDYAQLIFRNPVVRSILRWTPGMHNPHLFAESNVQKAALVRSAQIDDGRQKIVGLMAHARQFGNQDGLFGRTNESTGLLEQNIGGGKLKGFSVNEIAENPSRFDLTKAQRDWLDAMSGLEDEILALYKRNDIPIDEIALTDVERYAGRIHVALKTSDGTIIERGFIGPHRGTLTGKTGQEHHRRFATMKEAKDKGYITLSYESSLSSRAQSAYNRVVNKNTKKWILDNMPDNVVFRPTRRGEQPSLGSEEEAMRAFSQKGGSEIITGPNGEPTLESAAFIRDIKAMFPDAPLEILRNINSYNALQRMFALSGDASIATIQFLALGYKHPEVFGPAMGKGFANSFVRSLFDPKRNRALREKMLVDNADLIQDNPGLILSGSGIEATEAFAHGGVLSPGGFYQGTNPLVQKISRMPGIAGSIVRPFQQAYEAAMDEAGIRLLKAFEHKIYEGDKLSQPQRRRDLIDYVNNMRGLSSSARLGVTPNQRAAEGSILLAPRYRRAVGSQHVNILQDGLRGDLARKAYFNLMIGTLMSYVGLSIALGTAQGKTLDQIKKDLVAGLNPSSSRFLLWRAGRQGFGVGSKFVSDLRLMSRIVADPGDVLDFTEFNQNIGVRWARSQTAAFPANSYTYLTGADYMGEPVTMDFTGRPLETLESLGKTLLDDVTFLWVQSAAFEGGDKEERINKGWTDAVGIRGYPYPGPSLDDIAQRMFSKDFDELAIRGQRWWSKAQQDVYEEWKKLQTPEKIAEMEKEREKKKREAGELQSGLELNPEWFEDVRDLGP